MPKFEITPTLTPPRSDPGSPGMGSYLPARQVRMRYGISDMTLHRWLADKQLKFPRPFYFGRFRYWRAGELLDWEQSQPRGESVA